MRLLNVSFCLLIAALPGCGREPVLSESSRTSQTDSDQSSIAADESTKPAVSRKEANSTGENSMEVDSASAETELTRDAVAERTQSTLPTSSEIAARNAPEEAVVRKQPPTPTPEQIKDWNIPNFTQLELLTCHDGFGNSLLTCSAASPDESHYVVGGERLTLFSTKESKPVADFMHDVPRELAHYVGAVAISADGELVASGEKEGLVRVWNLETRKQVRSWQAYESRVSQIAFSPNAKSLATSSYSNEVTVWDVKSGKRTNSFETVKWELDGLEFVTDDSFVASGGDVGIWDISTGKRKRRLGSNVRGAALTYAPDQSLIIHGDGESALLLFDLQENRTDASKFRGHPADSGWIEYDWSASEPEMVANTKMSLEETVDFYDAQMRREGWIAREDNRHIDKKGKAWLPFIRGGQDVVVRLMRLSDGEFENGGTRIIVGGPDRSSWQLAEVEPIDSKILQDGIEAEDIQLPKDATDIDYNIDEKEIKFSVAGSSPKELLTSYLEQFAEKGWQKEYVGISDDDYSHFSIKKGKAELSFRARRTETITELSISGKGLLWSKPLSATPKRVSYGLWLIRHRHPASLNRLDEFWKEMRALPAPKPD